MTISIDDTSIIHKLKDSKPISQRWLNKTMTLLAIGAGTLQLLFYIWLKLTDLKLFIFNVKITDFCYFNLIVRKSNIIIWLPKFFYSIFYCILNKKWFFTKKLEIWIKVIIFIFNKLLFNINYLIIINGWIKVKK